MQFTELELSRMEKSALHEVTAIVNKYLDTIDDPMMRVEWTLNLLVNIMGCGILSVTDCGKEMIACDDIVKNLKEWIVLAAPQKAKFEKDNATNH